ncbi:MAG: hypothetical protein K0Q50_1456 [Vampirovibrio sp.]|jgi:hypothetical protein|nr:hypothetical protein [Vampirovibrio sp.]
MSDATPNENAAAASPEPKKPETAATATAEKPAAEAKPAAPAEPPFTVDVLLNCTARYTHKAWYLFYNNRQDMTFIRETPVRATLEARTTSGAEELHKLLSDAGVTTISRQDKVLSFTATFEQIQTVLKHPQSFMLDAVKI